MSECPASYGRKPTNHEALITISAPVTCFPRPEIPLVPSQQGIAVRWRNVDWLFALLDRYRMVAVGDGAPELRVQLLRLPPRALVARDRGSLESTGGRRRPLARGFLSASAGSPGSAPSPSKLASETWPVPSLAGPSASPPLSNWIAAAGSSAP